MKPFYPRAPFQRNNSSFNPTQQKTSYNNYQSYQSNSNQYRTYPNHPYNQNMQASSYNNQNNGGSYGKKPYNNYNQQNNGYNNNSSYGNSYGKQGNYSNGNSYSNGGNSYSGGGGNSYGGKKPWRPQGPYSKSHYHETALQEHGVTKSQYQADKFEKNSTYMSPQDWAAQNALYCQSRPEIVTRLDKGSLKELMSEGHCETDKHWQVILVKFCDTTQAQGGTQVQSAVSTSQSAVKARLMVSDGAHCSIAILQKSIYDSLNLSENQELKQFDVIKVKKCVVKTVGRNTDAQQSVIVFTDEIKIVYTKITNKIGAPQQDMSIDLDDTELDVDVPKEIIMQNLDVEDHEITYAKGESIPLKRLQPQLKGLWRVKIRLSKKYDVRTWQNAKGEGQLCNMEFMDKSRTRMQATIFGELIPLYLDKMIVGNCYEISQGVIKKNNPKFDNRPGNSGRQQKNEQSDICFIFDKYTKVILCENDEEIPTLESERFDAFQEIKFYNLLQIADMDANRNVNIIGVVLRVGKIDQINLKSGQQKQRRKALLIDDQKLSIIVCFWSDRHCVMLDNATGKVISLVKAKVSSYYHKSLNANEDSQLLIEPQEIEQVKKLRTWYDAQSDGQIEFHPLSGNLDVDHQEQAQNSNSAALNQEYSTMPPNDQNQDEPGFECGFDLPQAMPEPYAEEPGLLKQAEDDLQKSTTEMELQSLFEQKSQTQSEINPMQYRQDSDVVENPEEDCTDETQKGGLKTQDSYDEGGEDFCPNQYGIAVNQQAKAEKLVKPQQAAYFEKTEKKDLTSQAEQTQAKTQATSQKPQQKEEAKAPMKQSNSVLNPHDIRVKLLKEKRKQFSRQYHMRVKEKKEMVQGRGRANSGIGEERINQINGQATDGAGRGRGRARGRPRKQIAAEMQQLEQPEGMTDDMY